MTGEASNESREGPASTSEEPNSENPVEEQAAASTSSSSESSGPSTSSTAGQTLFSRLQAALPPNIVSSVQNNLPETLKHASENIDLAQIRNTLSSEFQRVQGVTRVQAEGYVHKSEALIREAMKEAGEVLREAVKIIPPEDTSEGARSAGLVWDGTDMWMLPYDPSESSSTLSKGKGKDSGRQSGETQLAVATRAESLLKRLRRDPEIIRHDPEAEQATRELYTEWLASEVDVKEGGIEGEEWQVTVAHVLGDSSDGQALQDTRDALGAFLFMTFSQVLIVTCISTVRNAADNVLETIFLPRTSN